jgi:hypothetical protein
VPTKKEKEPLTMTQIELVAVWAKFEKLSKVKT